MYLFTKSCANYVSTLVTDCFDRAISLKTDYADAFYNKGVALSDLGSNYRPMTLLRYTSAQSGFKLIARSLTA